MQHFWMMKEKKTTNQRLAQLNHQQCEWAADKRLHSVNIIFIYMTYLNGMANCMRAPYYAEPLLKLAVLQDGRSLLLDLTAFLHESN